MAEDKFKYTPELLEMGEKLGREIDKYLRAFNAESIRQGVDSTNDDEPIGDDMILSAWCLVGEFQSMDPDVHPIVMGAQPRTTTFTHAAGMANYWY